jgi:oligosaccharide repeat unit polymerase
MQTSVGPVPLAAASAIAVGVTLGLLYAAGVPAPWVLLGVCAATTIPVAVWGLVQGRFLEPLPLLATACALLFVARPLQLILEWRDLYSYFSPTDPIRRLVLLEGQEVARFVGERIDEPLENAMTRSLGACALFLVALLLGYRLPIGAWIARRLEGLRRGQVELNAKVAIALSLAIGLIAQAAIIARAGGPSASLKGTSDQVALTDSFVLFFLAGFAPAAMIVWASWRRPRVRREWVAFLVSLLAVAAFAVIAGSRGRLFFAIVALVVIVHYLWRPWRRRELAVGAVVLLAFLSSYLAFRESVDDDSIPEAARKASTRALDPQVIMNDITPFDHVLYATTIFGRTRDHEHGTFLIDGIRSYVPSAIDPDKPDGGDIAFRKVVWGNEFGAGRPPTSVGDLYIDFGFPGVAIGAVLIGVLARSLLGLLRGPPAGRQYRVAVYAMLLVVLYELVVDTFSLALGYVLTVALPFLIAVHVFGRVRRA